MLQAFETRKVKEKTMVQSSNILSASSQSFKSFLFASHQQQKSIN